MRFFFFPMQFFSQKTGETEKMVAESTYWRAELTLTVALIIGDGSLKKRKFFLFLRNDTLRGI